MPIKQSAKKAQRVSIRKKVYNMRVSRTMKDNVQNVLKTKKTSAYPKAQKAIDKACKQGIIKKNKASRMKSRIIAKLAVQPTA